MSSLCYVQARGGSKRFPMKALALWNGIPMLGDAIQKAQATGLFDYIVVSSDSPEILQVAHDYGAMPLWRTAEASSDTATDDDVAREVLAYFPNTDIVCKLYPCIPLITKTDILELYDFYDKRVCDGVYFTDQCYKDSGSAYIFNKKIYDKKKSISLKKYQWSMMRTFHACDINTPEDLEIAKQKAGK